MPNSLEAFALMAKNGVLPVLITNQSMVNRGLSSLRALLRIHENMEKAVKDAGGAFLDIMFCPHRPDENCACRKPAPGMIFKAADKHGIRLEQTAMVGDNAKDIRCARAAGCGRGVLVRTGSGEKAAQKLAKEGRPADHVADDLLDAVVWLLSPESGLYR